MMLAFQNSLRFRKRALECKKQSEKQALSFPKYIYFSKILFQSKFSPENPFHSLPKAQGLNLAVNVTEVLRLESSWRDFLDEEKLNSATKSEARFQEAVWEIILTEHNYMNGEILEM